MSTKTNRTPAIGDMVMVIWVDATSYGRWTSHEHAEKNVAMRCMSVGVMIAKDKQRILLTQSTSADRGVLDQIAIPTGCIKKVTRVRSRPKGGWWA